MNNEYPCYLKFLMKDTTSSRGIFLFGYFYPLNRNTASVSSRKAQSIDHLLIYAPYADQTMPRAATKFNITK